MNTVFVQGMEMVF